MFKLDFRTNFNVGDIVQTSGEDKLLGGTVRQERVKITEVKDTGCFKYRGVYLSDGEECLFFEDELVSIKLRMAL